MTDKNLMENCDHCSDDDSQTLEYLKSQGDHPESEKLPESALEQVSENVQERVLEKLPESVSENRPQRGPENVQENAPESVPESAPEKLPESVSEKVPASGSNKMPETCSKKMSETVKEKLPERTTEKNGNPNSTGETITEMEEDENSKDNKINSFVFMDLETTTLIQYNKPLPKITEIALVAVSREALMTEGDIRIVDKLVMCVDPLDQIVPIASQMTGLSNESLQLHNKQTFDVNVMVALRQFFKRQIPPICMIAHNGNKFDFPILRDELLRVRGQLDILCGDTLQAFIEIRDEEERTAFSNYYSSPMRQKGDLTLKSLHQKYLGSQFLSAHCAESDAIALMKIVQKQHHTLLRWFDRNAVPFITTTSVPHPMPSPLTPPRTPVKNTGPTNGNRKRKTCDDADFDKDSANGNHVVVKAVKQSTKCPSTAVAQTNTSDVSIGLPLTDISTSIANQQTVTPSQANANHSSSDTRSSDEARCMQDEDDVGVVPACSTSSVERPAIDIRKDAVAIISQSNAAVEGDHASTSDMQVVPSAAIVHEAADHEVPKAFITGSLATRSSTVAETVLTDDVTDTSHPSLFPSMSFGFVPSTQNNDTK
ncbi:uncharacterized protein LOC100371579 [Saccoglossus kowalevskii]|uniref:Uncharacterized protein LOC100371579 n=1 Tax=Saccoglossus kowalevskii TaxID=10224 RepID=A0ABM0GTN6_SACKO|nr:PREDICTED: uncharacterized protein LOC100371579 [Saccoglossus kowalevskii]